MGIFETSTPPAESPVENLETGHEEAGTEELQATELQDQETATTESGTETPATEKETPSAVEQGVEQPEPDYAKKYKELQRDYTKKAQELADLRRQAPQPPQQGQGQGADTEALNAKFIDDFNRDPVNTLYRFADAIADQKVRNYQQHVEGMIAPLYEGEAARSFAANMNTLAKSHPEIKTDEGYQKFSAKVNEIAQEMGNPGLVNNPPKRILALAATEAFGDSKAAIYAKAKAKGTEEAYNNIRAKQGLGGPTGAKLKEAPKSIEDQVADSIVSAGRGSGIFRR
jgi:hypothetical protein